MRVRTTAAVASPTNAASGLSFSLGTMIPRQVVSAALMSAPRATTTVPSARPKATVSSSAGTPTAPTRSSWGRSVSR